jgi:hypothetical protein
MPDSEMDENYRGRFDEEEEMGGVDPATGAEQAFGECFLSRAWSQRSVFYNWRKRLCGSEPVRFALVDARAPVTKDSLPVELILTSGDRLRVVPGVDEATLRTVLSVLRERA